jgi:GT2 family glycosyltransferase
MPVHHFISRLTLLVLGLWASGGVVAVSLVKSRWAKHHEDRNSSKSVYPGEVTRVRAASSIAFFHSQHDGLVSVIIPTHNRRHIIGKAMRSALAQSYPSLEVVVADDGSTDDTRTLVESFGPRVRYVRQANAGVSAARNFGMRHARGEFIAFLDSDDAWHPWKVEAQVAALRRHPDAGVVWTDMSAIDGADDIAHERYLRRMYSVYRDIDVATVLARDGTVGELSHTVPAALAAAPIFYGDLSSAILLGNLIHTSTVLFRRTWCQQTGGFDESYERAGEDYEFYIRLTSAGPVVFIDAPSTLYRIGVADQLTAPAMMLEIARNNLRAIETWLPRVPNAVGLPAELVKRRFSESFAWLGEAELDAGHPLLAARRLSRSILLQPALDRRSLLLASCALPASMRDRAHAARQTASNIVSRSSSSSG